MIHDGEKEGRRTKTYCESFKVGVQYLDDVPVKKGEIRQVAIKRASEERRDQTSRHQTRRDANIFRIFAATNACAPRARSIVALRYAQ